MEKEKTRKPVGRPRNDTSKCKIARQGIVYEPSDQDNAIELYFAIPAVFKKLYSLYKNIGVQQIYIKFDAKEVSFIAQAFSDETIAKTSIDCTKAHRYYCQTPVELIVSREASEKVINRIDPKFFDSITFVVKKFTAEINEMIIILNNPNLDSVSTHKLNLTMVKDYPIVDDWSTIKYPLNFRLKRQEFKKYTSDIESIADTLTIQKMGKYNMKFNYSKEGGILCVSDVFTNSAKIQMDSKLTDKEIVAATVKISEIKAISNSQIADEVIIYVDNTRKIMLKFYMDEAITTKVLINIENYRQP